MEQTIHNVMISEREKIELSGACEIISSTEKEIYIKLEKDILQIFGENLKINKLIPESKEMSISGKINGLNYVSNLSKKSILKKVFK